MVMLLLVKLRLRKSVRMRLLDIQPTPSAPSGQRRSAVFPKRMSRSTPQSLDVPRNQESSVPQLVADSSKELRSVMTKPRLLFRMPPRNSVLLSHRELASMSPNLFPTEECVDVPKEVCTRSRTNPRKVKKPVVK